MAYTKNPSGSGSLTEKEMSELRAARKCFTCKETGHMSRNCPLNSTIKRNGSKPPGIPNYSIQMDLVEDLSDHEDMFQSAQLGCIMFILQEEADYSEQSPVEYNWHEHYSWWEQ